MKCKNCGANYKTRELKCPYCSTENIIGRIWKAQRSEAELEYERARREMGKKSSPYVMDRVLTRAIVIIILVTILFFIGVAITCFIVEKAGDTWEAANDPKIFQEVKTYYKNGQYEKIDEMREKYDMNGEEYFPYMQAASMNFDYNSYLEHKYAFMDMTDEEKMEDDYELEYFLRDSVDVVTLNIGRYSELHQMNQELYDEYVTEIKSAWIGILKMTDEEIEYISNKENNLSSSDYETLMTKIKERSVGDANADESSQTTQTE